MHDVDPVEAPGGAPAPTSTGTAEPAGPPVFGPYQLLELIGRGGMGEIYRAYDTVRGRVVALKRLPTGLAADTGFESRFRAEAALAARLHEPHVIPIHDFGEIDGQLFIDMRLVDGPDLAAVLAADGALPPRRAVDVVSQVAAALDAAHAAGLAHRDIKPANILVVRAGSEAESDFVYVADFGIARTLDGSGSGSMTTTGTTVGSMDYVAPERFVSDPGGPPADVYALGCVLYQALVARRPFPVEGLPAVINAHLHTAPPAPSALRPELPPGLDAVVARAMAKDPDDRYPSAGALAAAARRALATTGLHDGDPGDGDLGDLSDGEETRAVAAPPAVHPAPGPAAPAAGSGEREIARSGASAGTGSGAPPRRRAATVLAACAALAILVAGAIATQLIKPTTAMAGTIVTVPVAAVGADPFMPPVTSQTPTALPPVPASGVVSGAKSGLYGGTLNNASCDPNRLVTFLQGKPDEARAWAEVEGIGPTDIPGFVGGLTPVVLRADTVVTNHGFARGAATTLRSVLQAGTAVLIDQFGVPRARCYCGNPLTPSTAAAGEYTGPRWSGFDPAHVVVVAPAPAPITQLRLVDQSSNAVFDRTPGTTGRSDHVQAPGSTATTTAEPGLPPSSSVLEPPTQDPTQPATAGPTDPAADPTATGTGDAPVDPTVVPPGAPGDPTVGPVGPPVVPIKPPVVVREPEVPPTEVTGPVRRLPVLTVEPESVRQPVRS